MFGGGRGMAGGAGGGSILRVVGRPVTARTAVTNLQEPISTSSSSSSSTTVTSPTAKSRPSHKPNFSDHNILSLSSGSSFPTPVSAAPPSSTYWPSFPAASSGSCCDDYEWVSVDGSEEERPIADDFFLGPVPSVHEVYSAVSALTRALDTTSQSQLVRDKFASSGDKDLADRSLLHQVPSAGPELDWMEPSLHLSNSGMLHPCAPQRVYDAFHLLQTEPTVQKMVISISSDRAVWDAVLNNEVVRELQEAYYADESNATPTSESSDETADVSNPALDILRWIFDNTKAKVMEAIEKITNLVIELFKVADGKMAGGLKDPFEEKLRTSFLLSIMVLLIVVVTRAHRA